MKTSRQLHSTKMETQEFKGITYTKRSSEMGNDFWSYKGRHHSHPIQAFLTKVLMEKEIDLFRGLKALEVAEVQEIELSTLNTLKMAPEGFLGKFKEINIDKVSKVFNYWLY